jgi:hypothetical protein
MKYFILTIKIKSDSFHYKTGSLLRTVVYARNYKSAISKAENKYWGSEYPSYEIIITEELENGLFPVILK